jgi:FRG domain
MPDRLRKVTIETLEGFTKYWHAASDEEAKRIMLDYIRSMDLLKVKVELASKESVASPPPDDDTLGWLSLMRHYGASTRLTDFTRSLFIAAYFALEDAARDSVIGAISKTWLTKCTQSVIAKMNDVTLLEDWGNRVGKAFDRIFFMQPAHRFVSAASPAKMHERLAIQQSIFLCPGDVTASFLENLRGMQGSAENVRPIVLDAGGDERSRGEIQSKRSTRVKTPREEILLKLMRVGIDRSSLFPGLEGFAQSMRSRIFVFRKLRAMENQGARLSPNIRWASKRRAAPTSDSA